MNLGHVALIDDILLLIREYVDIAALLSSMKVLKYSRKRFKYWKLKKAQSLIYYESKSFRKKLHTLVEYPQKQLSLNFRFCDSGITNVSSLGNVHTLNLSRCRGITDVSSLGNVHTLTLSGCEGITD